MTAATTATLTPRTFAGLTLGVVAFTIYGSLVPFHFKPRSFADAVTAFEWVCQNRLGVQSRSDFAANFILGLPLGFCLLAAVRLDKPAKPMSDVFAMAALWPWCVAFAAAVEFSQLWFPERTCSGSDIIAQGLGSLAGMMVWIVVGPRLTRWFRGVWGSEHLGGTAGRILVAYVALLMLASFLPLDLTLSPADVYHKYRDGKVTLVPFAETNKLAIWLELVGLYLPVGMLVAGIGHRPFDRIGGLFTVAVLGLLLAFTIEIAQLFVNSRSTSMTDVLLGGAGVTLGWLIVRGVAEREPLKGLSLEMSVVLGQAYVAFLIVLNWLPFNFDATNGPAKWVAVNWVPFAAAYEKNYLHSLEEAVAKTLLFTPLGALVIAKGRRRTVKRWRAMGVCVAVSALLEAGQLYLPSRVPNPTDLIFAATGGMLGALAALRLRAYGFGREITALTLSLPQRSVLQPHEVQLVESV